MLLSFTEPPVILEIQRKLGMHSFRLLIDVSERRQRNCEINGTVCDCNVNNLRC